MVLLTSFQRPKTIVGMVEWATVNGRLALRTSKGIQTTPLTGQHHTGGSEQKEKYWVPGSRGREEARSQIEVTGKEGGMREHILLVLS